MAKFISFEQADDVNILYCDGEECLKTNTPRPDVYLNVEQIVSLIDKSDNGDQLEYTIIEMSSGTKYHLKGSVKDIKCKILEHGGNW